MSTELALPNKNIVYLNFQKSGTETENGGSSTEHCSVSIDFQDSPILDQQDRFIASVTRFSVPVSQIPITEETGFGVYRYQEPQTQAEKITKINEICRPDAQGVIYENRNSNNYPHLVGRVVIKPCFTVYEFLETIKQALQQPVPNAPYPEIGGDGNPTGAQHYYYNDGDKTQPAAAPPKFTDRIKLICTPDMRYKVMINNQGRQRADYWYVKMDDTFDGVSRSEADLFAMLQFQQKPVPTHGDVNPNDLPGKRFFEDIRTMQEPFTTIVQGGSNIVTNYSKHVAHNSAADLSNHRRLVFSSDLSVKSERNVQDTYKRYLVDYQITQDTTFNYQISSGYRHDPYNIGTPFLSSIVNVSEPLPAHRVYTSSNPSSGRWQMLTLPSPLWRMEVRARLQYFSYKTMRFEVTNIPLPAGSSFSCKVIFVSKDEVPTKGSTDEFHH